jgi:SAM-dependent methyltransferase
MVAFGLTIFTGAFLLFLVQPLIARFILPWFGGGPAVWTTCMLFFQVLLLGGYAYAHVSIRRLRPHGQVLLHLALLAAALILLPITPGEHWKPADGARPLGHILWLLTVCLGLPYLVLSATGPLMQAWFSRTHPGVAPFRLYALSNVGSLLALLGYPVFVEPNFSRHAQAVGWSCGLGVFAFLAGWCGLIVWRYARRSACSGLGNASAESEEEVEAQPELERKPKADRLAESSKVWWLWFALPACASVLLLAVTNKICQDIAVIPFLWVLPLSLYLLSFIVSFDNPRWYRRRFWLPALAAAWSVLLWMTLGESVPVPDSPLLRPVQWLLGKAGDVTLFQTIALYLAVLFVCCMVCHGEVYRLRPAAERLTGYYLMIAGGGAFGGVFVAVLAPFLFRGYFELQTGFFALAVLVLAVLFVDPGTRFHRGRPAWVWAVGLLAALGFGGGLYVDATADTQNVVEMTRNFYGVLKVEEYYPNDPEADEVRLIHGGTTHGLQLVAPDKRRWPTSYYTSRSGIGRAMIHFPRQTNRRVGVVGLGAGTLAVWGRAGDYFRIYEINEEVERLARTRFSFLADSPARIDVVQGDARLSLEREPGQAFDVLALDAFSSDAIPVHLLTREAFEIYRRHLRPDGVLAVHVSNRCLNLEPIVLRAADHFHWRTSIVHDNKSDWEWDEDDELDEERIHAYASDWILLTSNEAFLNAPEIAEAARPPGEWSPRITMWTDEESNLFRILDLSDDAWLKWLR